MELPPRDPERPELTPMGAMDAAAMLAVAYLPAEPGEEAAEEQRAERMLIDWAPTGALGGWASDPWWPGGQTRR